MMHNPLQAITELKHPWLSATMMIFNLWNNRGHNNQNIILSFKPMDQQGETIGVRVWGAIDVMNGLLNSFLFLFRSEQTLIFSFLIPWAVEDITPPLAWGTWL